MLSGQTSQIVSRQLLIDPVPFELSWVPDEVLHRDPQIQQLECLWKESIESSVARHATLQGDYGTGKTAVARFVVRRLTESTTKQEHAPAFAYIPCAQFDSTSRILREAVHQVSGTKPSGGLARSDYVTSLKEEARTHKAVILILDDADRFILKDKGDPEVIFAIPTRIIDNLSVALITNSYEALAWLQHDLDSRFQDTFSARPIGFGDYKPGELADILARRVKVGYADGVFDQGEIVYTAKRCYELGLRARGLVKVGGLVGKLAAETGLSKISIDLIEKALFDIRRQEDVQPILDLDPGSRAILFKVYHEGSITVESLLAWFDNELAGTRIRGLSHKTFYAMSKRLKDLGLIAALRTSKGRERRWTEVLTIHTVAHELVAEAYARLNAEVNSTG